MRILALVIMLSLCRSASAAAPDPMDRSAMVIVLVIDGLRPDSITQEVTPNLHHLKTSGVWYTRAHSVFPTVTRVNTASISTGTLPSRHGIVSNALYLPAISGTMLSNGDYRNLLSLAKLNGGRIVEPKSLGEYLQAAGVSYVAVSSGSTGNALLLNPTAPYGLGSVINPGFEEGARVAFPDSLNAAIQSRLPKATGEEEGDAPLLWTERVLRDYVLDVLKPQVIVNWMGRTDSAQHRYGVGSPQAIAALRLVDQQIGLLRERIRQLKLEDNTNIIVTCDHGFDHEPPADVLAPVQESKLAPGDVVIDNEGGASLLYVKDHDAEKISRLVAAFQESPTTNAIFVAARRPGNAHRQCRLGATKGFAPGTFALEVAGLCHTSRSPDIVVTYRWDSTPNPFGVPGTQWVPLNPSTNQQVARNGHGGLNPYVTHSTLIAAGPDFKQRTTIDVPAGNQDIMPTLLAMLGLRVGSSFDGRILSEALVNPPRNLRPVRSSTRKMQVSTGAYCAELEISRAGSHAYLDYARRCASGR
jgi:predicted AlkP superfamily pyrophosphatase or phosphodiesterase